MHVNAYLLIAWKLVEENVNLKPIDGPSNGQREEKEEKKKPEEDEACGSEGKGSMFLLQTNVIWRRIAREILMFMKLHWNRLKPFLLLDV